MAGQHRHSTLPKPPRHRLGKAGRPRSLLAARVLRQRPPHVCLGMHRGQPSDRHGARSPLANGFAYRGCLSPVQFFWFPSRSGVPWIRVFDLGPLGVFFINGFLNGCKWLVFFYPFLPAVFNHLFCIFCQVRGKSKVCKTHLRFGQF